MSYDPCSHELHQQIEIFCNKITYGWNRCLCMSMLNECEWSCYYRPIQINVSASFCGYFIVLDLHIMMLIDLVLMCEGIYPIRSRKKYLFLVRNKQIVDPHFYVPPGMTSEILWFRVVHYRGTTSCAATSNSYAFSTNYHACIAMPIWHICALPILFWPWPPPYNLLTRSCLNSIFFVDPHW